MNSYSYFGNDQPAAPPRRKRSLSTSRGDYSSISQDYAGTPFQSNRIGRRNFSTDHIPGGYAYSGVSKPLGMGYNSSSQQALSNYGSQNGFGSYSTRQPFPGRGPNSVSYQSPFQHQQGPNFPQGHGNQMMHNQNQYLQQQQQQQQQRQQQQFSQQHPQDRRQAPYNSYGSNLNNVGNSYPTPDSSPMPIPRFMNPYAVQSSTKVPAVRAHQDYLKYAQPNVHYNPYQSQFSPTLMARPDIRPFQKPDAVPTFQKRDRSPFSSREQLDNLSQTPLSPQRPPPPKNQTTTGRLSVENLAAPTASDYENHLNSQLRDRRSVSPTRHSPASQMLQNAQQQQQRAYGANRHSTSPLPSNNTQDRFNDSRFGSRSSLNSPTSGYVSPRIASSREGSPFTRPISPFGRPNSPFSSSTSFGLDSSSLGLSHRTRSYSNSHSSTRMFDRSISHYGTSSATSGSSINRYDRSISAGSASDRLDSGPFRAKTTVETMDSTAALASTTKKDNRTTASAELDANNNVKDKTEPELIDCSSVSDSTTNAMDSLQVPGTGNDVSQVNNQQNRQNPQYSEAFTDHCDQYKSVTSKILSKNNKNRNSGEFGDAFHEQLQQQLQNEQMSQAAFDEFGYEQNNDQRAASPERKVDPYLEEKKVLENQLFNSPPISRVTSRNNSLAFDNLGSPTISRKNSNAMETFRKSPTPSRRNSAGAAASAASRKGSLPSDYIAHPDTFALSNEWSREKVAHLAHEARQRAHNPPANDALKKVGVWFTKQFVFLLIAGVNIMIAYAFYNLFTMLPADI